MITEPRFLIVENRPFLMAITYVMGEITDISGPYQCVGAPESSPSDCARGLVKTLTTALHVSKPLTLADLPDHLQTQIHEALKAST